MMHFRILTNILVLSLSMCLTKGLSQCNSGIFSRDTTPHIPNEPNYWFDHKTNITSSESGNILIRLDTSFLKTDSINPRILSNKRYGTYHVDSSRLRNVLIKDIVLNKTYSTGFGYEEFSFDLKNCYIRCFSGPGDKSRISVFDYK